jgi:Cu/Ag efflux protein CusF
MSRKYLSLTRIATCALVLLLALALPTLAADAKGKVKNVAPDKNELVITDNNKDWAFGLDKNSTIFVNDKAAKLADLQVGDEVSVTYEKRDDKLHAHSIRAMRR